ncbi:hypothetical protein ACN27G_18430 [Plantactinospora sp. WMMB334]|uniref:hypothetical protein n=1 Tax=Plantactinospora sp. WMMB334 TaxID=3404119 RepID=UPI003B94785C
MPKRVTVTLAMVAALVAAIAFSPPAQASPAPATVASAQTVEPLIDERRCNANQLPRQIWLTYASRPTRCFGGTVGSFNLGNNPATPVQWLSSGDYHGTIYCVGLTLPFGPATDALLNRTCTRLDIRPAS